MRATDSQNGLTALAIAGTNVVLVGWDMPEADIRNLGTLGPPATAPTPRWRGNLALRNEKCSILWIQILSWRAGKHILLPAPDFSVVRLFLSPNQNYTYRLVARQGNQGLSQMLRLPP